jgi:PAS domain S-box-containing protein
MRLRTKIVLAITGMVAALVIAFSVLYLSQLLRQRVASAFEDSQQLASQIAFAANSAVPDLSSTRVDTGDPEAVRKALGDYLRTDITLSNVMESLVGSWPFLYDAALVDKDGRALLHTNPSATGKPVPVRPAFAELRYAPFRKQLSLVLQSPQIYEVQLPLDLNGTPFGTVRLGVSTVFMRNEIRPRLRHAFVLSVAAVLLSLVLAASLSHVALAPLQRISDQLDRMVGGQPAEVLNEADPYDEYGLVTLKIAHLGRQINDAKDLYLYKSNLDHILANLQDGLILFTRDWRIVLVSASSEKFLGRPRAELLGRKAEEVFTAASPLGAFVLDSFRQARPVRQREIEADGRRIQVALDFIQQGGTPIGALLTIRDAESVRRIEDEIELSRRLAAIGSLTSGVAHEVKNPLNAIALHFENLRQKLPKLTPDASQHIDVVGEEIHRLDRVVQNLVDFTRPVELCLVLTDLHKLVEQVTLLAQPEAQAVAVAIECGPSVEPLPVKIDVDLIKQALLNVVINGVQAMPGGGTLRVSARRENGDAQVAIADQGPGVPADVRSKIFNLFFTTKHGGSGIGLATTYRTMQMHHGSVSFESIEGTGTTFFLRLPLAPADDASPPTSLASS